MIELIEKNGYKILENGQVFSKKKMPLKGGNNNKGYNVLCLSLNNIQTSIKRHRIIALKYIPNPENKPQVNHKNGIKTDNRAENLEWCTNKENAIHAVQNGLRDLKSFHEAGLKATTKKVYDTKTGIIYPSAEEPSIIYNINRQTLRGKLNGRIKNNTSLIYI
jgi:hypothetical protein